MRPNVTNKPNHLKIIAFCLTLTLSVLGSMAVSRPAMAETRYVSDNLTITLRRGEGTDYQVLRTLVSGTPLQVIQVNADSGYSQVRTPNGVEGWVLTRFLMDQPSARAQLDAAKSRAAKLETQNKTLSDQIAALSEEKKELQNTSNNLDKSNSQLNSELKRIKTSAGRALEIESENKELRSKVIKLERDNQALAQENETLKDRNARDWFMVGAGVAILSLLLGLILARFGRRRKTSWSSM